MRVFGVEEADAIAERLEDERFLMAHGQRMTPVIGSDTSETLLANKEQEAAIKDLTKAAKKVASGNWGEAVLHLLGSTIEGAYRGAQAPIDEATRDVVGALLMSKPSELARILEAHGATPEEAENVSGLLAKANAYGPAGVAMLAQTTHAQKATDQEDDNPFSKFAPGKAPPEAPKPPASAPPAEGLTKASYDTEDDAPDAAMSELLGTVRGLEASGDSAVSPKGAIGRYQIMPKTAEQYGIDVSRLTDPAYAKQAATKILTDLSRRYHGEEPAILIAYNAGPKRADEWLAAGRDNSMLPYETQKYLARAGLGDGPVEEASNDGPPSGALSGRSGAFSGSVSDYLPSVAP
jgi:hypothetical protein